MGLSLSIIVGIALIVFIERYLDNKNTQKIDKALPMLDGIFEGKKYVGKNCTVIKTNKLFLQGHVFLANQLCKTENGNWFHFRFTLSDKNQMPFDLSVSPCDEEEVKYCLENDISTYKHHFGEPELA